MDRDLLIKYVSILNKIESIPYDVRMGNNDLDYSFIHFVEEKASQNQEFAGLITEIKALSPAERDSYVKQFFNEQESHEMLSNSSSEEDEIAKTFGVDAKDIQHLFLENGHEIFVFYYSEWGRNVVLENSKEGQSLSEQMKTIQDENEKYQSDDEVLNASNIMSEEFVNKNLELEFYSKAELENHLSLLDSLSEEDIKKIRYLLQHYSELNIQGINVENMIYIDSQGEIHEATIGKDQNIYVTKPAGIDYSTEENEISNSDELASMLDDDSEEYEEELEEKETKTSEFDKPKILVKTDYTDNSGFANNVFYLFVALFLVLFVILFIIFVL